MIRNEIFDFVSKEQHIQLVFILNGLDTVSNEFKNGKEMEPNMHYLERGLFLSTI